MTVEDRPSSVEHARQQRQLEAERLFAKLLEVCPTPGATQFAQLRRDQPALDAEWTILARGFERLERFEQRLRGVASRGVAESAAASRCDPPPFVAPAQ